MDTSWLTNTPMLLVLVLDASYLLIGLALIILNLVIYERITPFDLHREIFDVQNRAVGQVVRGQILGQGIMIATVIYFLGVSYDTGLTGEIILASLGDVAAFGVFGIVLFQILLALLGRMIPLERELVVDRNEVLGSIVETSLVAVALIMSVALYAF